MKIPKDDIPYYTYCCHLSIHQPTNQLDPNYHYHHREKREENPLHTHQDTCTHISIFINKREIKRERENEQSHPQPITQSNA